jgi:hypothetical protein
MDTMKITYASSSAPTAPHKSLLLWGQCALEGRQDEKLSKAPYLLRSQGIHSSSRMLQTLQSGGSRRFQFQLQPQLVGLPARQDKQLSPTEAADSLDLYENLSEKPTFVACMLVPLRRLCKCEGSCPRSMGASGRKEALSL